MLSYPEHITTCISTQQRECSPTHPKGIQKSLQNTSPRGVNAAVKSVFRLIVHLKSRTPPPSIFPSGVTPIWSTKLTLLDYRVIQNNELFVFKEEEEMKHYLIIYVFFCK